MIILVHASVLDGCQRCCHALAATFYRCISFRTRSMPHVCCAGVVVKYDCFSKLHQQGDCGNCVAHVIQLRLCLLQTSRGSFVALFCAAPCRVICLYPPTLCDCDSCARAALYSTVCQQCVSSASAHSSAGQQCRSAVRQHAARQCVSAAFGHVTHILSLPLEATLS